MMTIHFSCPACGLTEAPVQVPFRETPLYDVCEWMRNDVAPCVADVHRQKSPTCRGAKCSLLIPTPGESRWIGAPPLSPENQKPA